MTVRNIIQIHWTPAYFKTGPPSIVKDCLPNKIANNAHLAHPGPQGYIILDFSGRNHYLTLAIIQMGETGHVVSG